MTDGAWCVLIVSLGSKVTQLTVCKVSVLTWNTISQTLWNSGLEHGKVIYLVLVSACSYVYECTYIWRPEEHLECHLPDTAVYLFETVFLIGLDCDKLSMSVSTSQGSSCLCLPSADHHTWNSPCLSMRHPNIFPLSHFLILSRDWTRVLMPLCLYAVNWAISPAPKWLILIVTSLWCCLMCLVSLSGVVLCGGSHTAGPLDPFPSFFLFFPLGVFVQTWGFPAHSEKPVFSCLQEETQFSEKWEIIEPNFIFC